MYWTCFAVLKCNSWPSRFSEELVCVSKSVILHEIENIFGVAPRVPH